MNKKGFTLVELLAVIAILAILVIIAMPNVLEMFNKAKQDAFETEVQSHVKAVANEFITTGKQIYSNVVDGAAKLPMDGEEIDYYIELDTRGNIKTLNVTNGDYKISATGTSDNPVKIEQIGDTIKSVIAESGETFTMNSSGVITGGGNNQEPVEYKLSGTWIFKDELTLFRDYSNKTDHIENVSFKSKNKNYSMFDISELNSATAYIRFGSTLVYDDGWFETINKTVTFTSEQEVSKEFYNWFTANATKK